ncbi:MAG: hypothetical protein V4684_11845 [Pseudomonadota bacterium]
MHALNDANFKHCFVSMKRLVAAATFAFSVAAIAQTTLPELEQTKGGTQRLSGAVVGCFAKTSSELKVSRALDADIETLYKLNGFTFDAAAYVEGMAPAIQLGMDARKYVPKDCDGLLRAAKQLSVALARSVSATRNFKAVTGELPAQPRAVVIDACPLSADTYQERIRSGGKVSDMTCMIKAGRREMDAATR